MEVPAFHRSALSQRMSSGNRHRDRLTGTPVVDTTEAGDAFAAALITALARDKSPQRAAVADTAGQSEAAGLSGIGGQGAGSGRLACAALA